MKNIALDKTDDSNPRQAILRHAKEAAENPYWVAPAYKKWVSVNSANQISDLQFCTGWLVSFCRTQPETLFAEESDEDEEAEKEPEWKKRKIWGTFYFFFFFFNNKKWQMPICLAYLF